MQEEPKCIQGLGAGLLPEGSQETRKGGWGHSSPPPACCGRQKRWPSCSQHLGLPRPRTAWYSFHFTSPSFHSGILGPDLSCLRFYQNKSQQGLCLDWGSVTLIFGWRSLLKHSTKNKMNSTVEYALLHHFSSDCHPPWFEDCWRCKKRKNKTKHKQKNPNERKERLAWGSGKLLWDCVSL